jgi:hypothetical protein
MATRADRPDLAKRRPRRAALTSPAGQLRALGRPILALLGQVITLLIKRILELLALVWYMILALLLGVCWLLLSLALATMR